MLFRKEALHVSAMKHNLIPLFLMREDILVVDNLPMVQLQHPTKYHHSTHFSDEDLLIPLSFHVIFSYFTSKNPFVSKLNGYDNEILFLTTGNINPHNKIYSENERYVLDHEGNVM